MNRNEFGLLVKSYREQRGWTQAELAERWGHERSYVSQIERGVRKLDSTAQVVRLADILDIPQEKLETIGRGVPERKKSSTPDQNDDAILQMLLAPGRDMIKVSYIAWMGDQHPAIEESLRNLVLRLESALISYHGEFINPAKQLLAYAYQMQGKIAFDRLDYAAAGGYFSEMIDLGNDLNDSDLIALGMVKQADVLRKRGRYAHALRCFEAAKPFVVVSDPTIQGVFHTNLARTYHYMGSEVQFQKSIDEALDIASHTKENIDSLANGFNLDLALQFEASGYTALGKPEKSIEIYKEIEHVRSFRPLRDQGAYTIEKARAYLEAGFLDFGIDLSLKGLALVSEYRSKRHIARLEATRSRLRNLPIGKDKRLNTLWDALRDVQEKQTSW